MAEIFVESYKWASKETMNRVIGLWKKYKEEVGLEGDEHLRMKSEGKSEGQIESYLKVWRQAREELVELFNSENLTKSKSGK